MQKLIYIDDDVINLALFELQFKERYDVITCSEPLDALNLISEHEIQLIISDYLMPEMNGMELITQVKKRHPECICIMLSGCMRNRLLLENELLFEFVSKPYDFNKLLGVINDAFRQSESHCEKM